MFEDFSFSNYWKTKNKLRKTRELINRIYGDYLYKLERIDRLKFPTIPVIPEIPTEEGKAYLIIHCHNPEGKEINSIEGVSGVSVYLNDDFLINGVSEAEEHNQNIEIDSGSYTVRAEFNGMTQTQEISIIKDEIKNVIFNFDRTNANFDYSESKNNSIDYTFDIVYPYDPPLIDDQHIYGLFDIRTAIYITAKSPDGIAKGYAYSATNYNLNMTTFNVYGIGTINFTERSGNTTTAVNTSLGGASAYQTTYPSNIPIQSNFNEWYIQQNRDGIYPYCNFTNTNDVLLSNIIGYNLHLISAKKIQTDIKFYLSQSYQLAIGYQGGTKTYSDIGTLNYLKMSSIPYDMTGSAI